MERSEIIKKFLDILVKDAEKRNRYISAFERFIKVQPYYFMNDEKGYRYNFIVSFETPLFDVIKRVCIEGLYSEIKKKILDMAKNLYIADYISFSHYNEEEFFINVYTDKIRPFSFYLRFLYPVVIKIFKTIHEAIFNERSEMLRWVSSLKIFGNEKKLSKYGKSYFVYKKLLEVFSKDTFKKERYIKKLSKNVKLNFLPSWTEKRKGKVVIEDNIKICFPLDICSAYIIFRKFYYDFISFEKDIKEFFKENTNFEVINFSVNTGFFETKSIYFRIEYCCKLHKNCNCFLRDKKRLCKKIEKRFQKEYAKILKDAIERNFIVYEVK